MDLTETAISRIAQLGAGADGKRIHTLPTGQVDLISADGSDATTLLDATKDTHGLLIDKPLRIKEAVTIETADSLVDYITRFKTDGTLLFANIATNTFHALLDYHAKPGEPDHADHAASLKLPHSQEWTLWTGISGKWQPQTDFGLFLKENAPDVSTPDPASLLEIAMDIRAIRNVEYTKAVRLSSGNESFEYTDTTTANTRKGALTIPEDFVLTLPVYFNDVPVDLNAFLRWQLDEGKLFLAVALQRAERVRQARFKMIAEDIATRAAVPVIYGRRS